MARWFSPRCSSFRPWFGRINRKLWLLILPTFRTQISAGIGALVGAYVTRQHTGRRLPLAGVCNRVRDALKVTRVDQFFAFFDSVSAAEEGSAA